MESERVRFWLIYKSLYEHEVDVRHYYDGKIGFVFTILSVTAAALYNCAKYVVDKDTKSVIMALLCISMGVFIVQLILTFMSFFTIKYVYRDFPVNWIKVRTEDKINLFYKSRASEETTKEEIEKMFIKYYEICASDYYEANIKKRKCHHILNMLSYLNFIIILVMYAIRLYEGG